MQKEKELYSHTACSAKRLAIAQRYTKGALSGGGRYLGELGGRSEKVVMGGIREGGVLSSWRRRSGAFVGNVAVRTKKKKKKLSPRIGWEEEGRP